jgi:methyl-accepting chemotaxis protein
MKNWTIGKRITTGFGSVILIILLLGFFAYARLTAIREHSERIARETSPAIEACAFIAKSVEENLRLAFTHVGSNDRKDMEEIEADMKKRSEEISKNYETLEAFATTEQGKGMLEKVKSRRSEYVKLRGGLLATSRQNATNKVESYSIARTQLAPAAASYIAELDTLVKYCKAESTAANEAIESAVHSSLMGIVIALATALVLGAGLAFTIVRSTGLLLNHTAEKLNLGASQVTLAAGQVSSFSQSLAEGASEQAASLEETSASLEEMSSMTQRNAENAQKANDLAREARAAAERGADDMHAMSRAMDTIKASSDDIAKIIKTIDEIAFQTNILALNAAVEAARAGEAGMGFAVVADEVRSLAQRSAQAAKETSAKIEGAISNSSQGVEINAKVAHTLNDIVAKARQVDELVAEVAGGCREQTQGITQINTAVGQMDKVTQSNAADAEESAAAAEELNAQAESMKDAVSDLVQLVGGHSGFGQSKNGDLVIRQGSRRENMAKTNKSAKAATNGNHRNSMPTATAQSVLPSRTQHTEIPLAENFRNF